MIDFGISLYKQEILDVVYQNQGILKNYIKAFNTIIHFEEEEMYVYLQQFNKSNIQLNFHMDQMFYFPVTVSKYQIQMCFIS